MIIGATKEIKSGENRVGITPAGVQSIVSCGHTVLIESCAGTGSGFDDQAYKAAGAEIVNKQTVFDNAEMIVKVKEPVAEEIDMLRKGQIIFTYLHLASEPNLTIELMKRKITSIAYETVQLDNGALPLLSPMSEVAGKMAVQLGARFLEKPQGGMGVLLGGIPGVPRANVVIVGGGMVGTNAAKVAMGMGARVTIVDKSIERLRYLDDIFGTRLKTLLSNSYNIENALKYADLLIGAVLVPGAKTPRLVTEKMVKQMKPGSVIIDVAVDQGGVVETIDRVTTHSNPTYKKHGVVHYAVANIPGAVARTSTFALTNATLPYIMEIAEKGLVRAILENKSLARGVNTYDGKLTCRPVAEAHNYSYEPLEL